MIAVVTLVHIKIQNYPKRKITGADNRPNQALLSHISDKNHPIISPEHLGRPMDHIECLQRGHQRKISRKISMVFWVTSMLVTPLRWCGRSWPSPTFILFLHYCQASTFKRCHQRLHVTNFSQDFSYRKHTKVIRFNPYLINSILLSPIISPLFATKNSTQVRISL